MYRKFLIILICLLSFECSKKEIEVVQPSEKDKALKIYAEGVKEIFFMLLQNLVKLN